MPQEIPTNRLLHRPSRRTVLKTGAGTVTVLGAAPAAAAAQESDERPTAVDNLISALDCFERLAETAPMALVVDFRREGIQHLREETDDEDDLESLRRAESHNEAAAREVRFGDQNAAQTQLDRTTDALAEVDDAGGLFDDSLDELVNDLIRAPEEPFPTIFGEDVESQGIPTPNGEIDLNDILEKGGELIDVDPTLVKLALRAVNSEDGTLELSLPNISRISDPKTSRQAVFKTERYLERIRAAIELLNTNNYVISFEDLSTLTVSRDSTSYSTSVGLASWLWATGYATSRVSINLVVARLGLGTLLNVLNPITTAIRRVLEIVLDVVLEVTGDDAVEIIVSYAPDLVKGLVEDFIREWLSEQTEDGEATGRLDALIPFGLAVTHLLKAEVDTAEDFGEQFTIGDVSPAEELESFLANLAATSNIVLPLEIYSDLGGINFLVQPIEEFDDVIIETIDENTDVDIRETIGSMQEVGQSLFLRVLNSQMVGNRLPDEVVGYLSNQLRGS